MTDANGIASGSIQLNQPASSTTVTATFTTDTNYSGASASKAFTVSQEDASLEYTGDTIGVTNVNMTLEATVKDSAAASYLPTSPNPEPGGTIGDITKMWIRFDFNSGMNCGGTTSMTPKYVRVVDTGAVGDGIGTARSTFTSSSDSVYCVVATLVASASGGTNTWYTASPSQPATVVFYNNYGQFVTGGGWITDPNANRGNFGFNARYNKSGQPQGQMVYVYRDLYSGPCTINGVAQTCTNVPATYVIKSNSLTALGFTGKVYPIKANLSGGATLQVNRASDGASIFSEGGGTFDATVTDTGTSSGIGLDDYSLTFTKKSGTSPFKYVPTSLLKGGNVVIHLQ